MEFLNSDPVPVRYIAYVGFGVGVLACLYFMWRFFKEKRPLPTLLFAVIFGGGLAIAIWSITHRVEPPTAPSTTETADSAEAPATVAVECHGSECEAEPPPSPAEAPIEPAVAPTAEESPSDCGASTDCAPSEHCVSGDCVALTVDDCERPLNRCEVFVSEDHECVVESVDRTCCVSNAECRQRHNDEAGWECVPAEGTFECRFRPCEHHDDCADGFRCESSGTDGHLQCRPFACGDTELLVEHDCVPDPSAEPAPRITLGGNLEGGHHLDGATPRNGSVRVERRHVTPVSNHCDHDQRDCSECPDMASRRSCMYGEE